MFYIFFDNSKPLKIYSASVATTYFSYLNVKNSEDGRKNTVIEKSVELTLKMLQKVDLIKYYCYIHINIAIFISQIQ